MKILIAGDYVPRNRLAALVEENKYNDIFGEVKNVISSADYSIVNFESPIVEEGDKPISKLGPNLRCKPNGVDAIKYAGFKCATLANNHIRDWGDSAVRRTISIIKEHGLDCVGAGDGIESAGATLYHRHGDKTLAVINCCENEFSIAGPDYYGANPLNPVRQYYAIKEAKAKSDYVVIIVHGGHEHYQLPSPRMQDTYRYFIDLGADIVVNHHQHCYSGYEIYKGKPIVYGTGNFCMDKDPIRVGQIWNYGYMVQWDTDKPEHIDIIPYDQCGDQPMVHLLSPNAFDEQLNHLNEIIGDRQLLEAETKKYYSSCNDTINNYVIEPIQNRFIAGLQHMGILPSLVSKKWLLKLQDFILCESHRDKMDFFFHCKNK